MIPLLVVIPLLFSPLCVVIYHARTAWCIALLTTWISFVIAILIVIEISQTNQVIIYHMGGWLPSYGIEYKVSHFSALLMVLITGVGAILMPFAYSSVKHDIPTRKHAFFYTAFLLCFAALLGVVMSNDLFNMYVFLEMASLAAYALIAMGKTPKALTAAFGSLIIGSIGTVFYLIGLGFLYAATGAINLTDISQRMITSLYDIPIMTGFIFLVMGVFLKLASFPFHSWLCKSYTYAPTLISAFLSATFVKVILYVLMRVFFELYGNGYEFLSLFSLENIIRTVLYPLAMVIIIVGSYMAISVQDIKNSLAYLCLAHMGYILLGISLVSLSGITASIVQILYYSLATTGLFIVCGAILMRFNGSSLMHFRGIGQLMPLTMVACIICCLSIIGVPATAGFISKWLLFQAVLELGKWDAVIVILLGSFMSIIYVWRIIEAAYFYEHPNAITAVRMEAPLPVLLSLWLFALLVILGGFHTEYSYGIATHAADFLIGGGNE